MVKDRVALMLGNQANQVIEHVLDTQPNLGLLSVVKIDPDNVGARVAFNHSIGIITNTGLLLPSLTTTVTLFTAIP
ncbi:hypothetical protein D3C75_1227400 [compost metagenome]